MNTKKLPALAFLNKILGEEETFGSMIKNIRVCEEMTQIDFAKLLKIKTQYLSDIENNRRVVSAKKAFEYAEKLGYMPEDFVKLALQDEANKSFKKIGCYVHIDISVKHIIVKPSKPNNKGSSNISAAMR